MVSKSSSKLSDFGFQKLSADQKTQKVRNVFQRVAQKYDLMNDLMSLGAHHLWKNRLIEMLTPCAGKTLLDVAGGTGDIAARFLAAGGKSAIVADPSSGMMAVGKNKHKNLPIEWIESAAENLPLPDGEIQNYTISFGLRNVTDIDAALGEAHRVLQPGGRFLCLEFSRPVLPMLEKAYDLYSFRVIPWLGEKVANDRDSYQYLVESIRRFPAQKELEKKMTDAGFACVRHINLTGGICAIHEGYKV